ncbi:hypothetical protein CC78DRAFT_325365 [Lojkania enalia]|uniref:Uncharacterized protein n=1 Tax=Lojkania enalia TaxID=147567 RepID=A0A9P4K410_9PLEO|nr:hypothetical protein CC78DRAFT_325365 [Didymosphaeria enalia]
MSLPSRSPYGLPATPRPMQSPFGLPATPRPVRMAYPLDTSFHGRRVDSATHSPTITPDVVISEKNGVLIDGRRHGRETMIFAQATIPLSPATTAPSCEPEPFYDPVQKRSVFARLFCCFGREERIRRRKARDLEFEKPENLHWTEL